MGQQQFLNDLWAGDQMLAICGKSSHYGHRLCLWAPLGKESPHTVISSQQQQPSHAHWPSFSPSTWIRFKRVTHASSCAPRITCKEGSSRPANMTVQKSSLLFARTFSQEIEEDINKIRTRFFKSHPMLLTVESHQYLQFILLKPHTAARQQSSLNIYFTVEHF